MGSMVFVVFFVGATMLAVGECDETDGRLPQNFRPYHYNLELHVTPDFYQGAPPFPFSGKVQIYLTCIVASDVITINSKELTIVNSSVKISLAPGQSDKLSEPVLSSWRLNQTAEFLYVTTTHGLTRDVSYILEIGFNGTIRNDTDGLYYDNYTTSDTKMKYMIATDLEPNSGRMLFPGFDEPEFKATFNVTIVRRPPAVSVGNSPLVKTLPRNDGWVADVYNKTPVMALYLVAFAVGDFKKIPAGKKNGYEVNIWARPEVVHQTNFYVEIAPKIQAWFDQETGITYREPKSDHLLILSMDGAMENWGLITYVEEDYLYDSQTSSAERKYAAGNIMSHEIAHLWFGDLVTCKWWDDLWLNEGFAAYYEVRGMSVLGWETSEAAQLDTQVFLEQDQRNSSDPVRKSIPTVWNASYSFDGSTYPKGGAMLHMLEGILTMPTFKKGIQNYLQKYQYKSVVTDDLWEILTKQAATDGIKNPDGSPLNVKLRMDPWLNQMGFPLVSVTRHPDGTAKLVRSHFLHPPNQVMTVSSPYKYAWDVPITIVSQDDTPAKWNAAPSAWININVSEITLPGFPTDLNRWAIVNAKFFMYYRVMYDNASLAAIVSQLLQNKTMIHVESRSQIIDDAFSVARAGYFPETRAMETTRYLAKEKKYGPWSTALRHLKYSDRLIRKLSWGRLQRSYVLGLADPVYKLLGWVYKDNETPFQQFLRRDIIAVSCVYGHAACLTEARKQYKYIFQRPAANNSVDPNNLPTVLCVGVREGTEADWQMTFDQYLARKKSQIRDDRHAYLYGCTCTNNTALLIRLVEALENTVPHRDRNTLAMYLAHSDHGSQILWNYLDSNWDNASSGIELMEQLVNIGLGFSTRNELDNLLAFRDRHPPKSDAGATSYTNLILDIENNIRWLKEQGPGLQEWLETHQPPALPSKMVKRCCFGSASSVDEPLATGRRELPPWVQRHLN